MKDEGGRVKLKLENLKHMTGLKPPITNNLDLERSLELLLLPNPDNNSRLGCSKLYVNVLQQLASLANALH